MEYYSLQLNDILTIGLEWYIAQPQGRM